MDKPLGLGNSPHHNHSFLSDLKSFPSLLRRDDRGPERELLGRDNKPEIIVPDAAASSTVLEFDGIF